MTKQKVLKEIIRIISKPILVSVVGPEVKGFKPTARISLPTYEL
jgi:hypothetical protein